MGEKLNPKSGFDPGFKIGDQVRIRRGKGNIEDDWVCAGIISTEDDRLITVIKDLPDGKYMRKTYSQKKKPDKFQELLGLNKEDEGDIS